MKFAVLSSGSRANCAYVEAAGTAVLIDCGLSAAQAERRMRGLGLKPQRLQGLLVTHEHRDHLHGVATFSRRWKVPVFANRKTARFIRGAAGLEEFVTGADFEIGALKIGSFALPHDACDPVGFTVEAGEFKFALATDLGCVTSSVEEALQDSSVIVLESNHDVELLMSCHYHWALKQRIFSSDGHLSNHEAGALLERICHPGLRAIVLAHISENSNTPSLARQTVGGYLMEAYQRRLICAGVKASTPLLELVSGLGAAPELLNQQQSL